MKLLFFDMEFANGQVPGSIYSFGYLITDELFRVLTPPCDILINPECEWNAYVEEHILAYPKSEVEAAPPFPEVYGRIRALFEEVDVAVGFSVSNDNRALKKDCERYGLELPIYQYFDIEKLCKLMKEHKEAHGLKGYATAWCGKEPDHAHRSDGDAVATMELFRAICVEKHVTADMVLEAFSECAGTVTVSSAAPKQKKRVHRRSNRSARQGRSRRGHKKSPPTASAEKDTTQAKEA